MATVNAHDVIWTTDEKQLCLDCSWCRHKIGYLEGKRYRICMECGKMTEVIREKTTAEIRPRA